jgi:hypothetical protein
MEMNMESQWKHVGSKGEESKIRFRIQLSGDTALKRDHAIMNYQRGVSDGIKGGPIYIDPNNITVLWDEAFMAGIDSRNEPDPEPIKPAAKKKKTKKKRAKK